MKNKCSIDGCNRKSDLKKHQLCRTHYMRYRRKGEVGEEPIRKRNEIKPYSKVLVIPQSTGI